MARETPLTAAEIYEQVTGGNGPGRLATAAEAAARLRQVLTELTADVRAAADETSGSWEGGAGDHAALLTMPLAFASETDGALLHSVARTLTDQITAFAMARDTVVPVPPQPPAPTKGDVVRDLLGGNSYQAKLDAYERDALNNVAAFRSYHQASTTNSDALPARYTPLKIDGIEITRAEPTGDRSPGPRHMPAAPGRTSHRTASPGTSATGSTSAPTGSPDQLTDAARTPTGATEPAPARTGGTHAAAHTPNPVGPASPPPPGRPGTHVPPGQHTWTPAPTGTDSPGRVVHPAPGTGTRNVPLRAGDLGPHSNAPATPPPNAPGRVPTAPPGHQRLPGRGSGAGTAGGLGDNVARGGTTPAPGTADTTAPRGTAGPPVGAAARGDGEDKERRRPGYLRNPDAEDTFSDPLPKTPPPVIGQPPRTRRGGT